MSKELDPIEALDKLLDGYSKGMVGRSYYDIVREALQRLEAIDNANPSEALECLEVLEQDIKDRIILDEDRQLKLCAVIKQALLKAEKEHKAFEIIKEKECDMRWFKYCIKVNSEVETYNNGLPEYYEKLTQEEFDLLKEVLK